MTPDDGLIRWIDMLAERLVEGDLAQFGPIDLGDGSARLPGETTIRVMLADLRDLDDPAGSATRDPAWRQERRYRLLNDFKRLRELLG